METFVLFTFDTYYPEEGFDQIAHTMQALSRPLAIVLSLELLKEVKDEHAQLVSVSDAKELIAEFHNPGWPHSRESWDVTV